MDEISVLDYLKFKLNPKNFGKEILPEENPAFSVSEDETEEGPAVRSVSVSLPEKWFAGKELVKTRLNPFFLALSLALAIAAQIVLEPNIVTRTAFIPWLGGGLYLLCALSFAVSYFMGNPEEEQTESLPEDLALVKYESQGSYLCCEYALDSYSMQIEKLYDDSHGFYVQLIFYAG